MGSSRGNKVSLFNNSLLSDITICQIKNGATIEYLAHKAILCAGLDWIVRALTGRFQEASSDKIDVHDDDPVYFEVFLRYLYDRKWHGATASKKEHNLGKNTGDLSKVLTAVGVYCLADKYDVDGLSALAIDQVSETARIPVNNYSNYSLDTNVTQLVRAHYNHCVKGDCGMDRKICRLIVKQASAEILKKEFADLVRRYPALAMDMFLTAHDNGGKLRL